MQLKRTPLFQLCVNANCRLVPFAGWEMPIQFSGLVKEHQAVRNSAGLFDISHMGVLSIKGTNAKDALQKLVPTDLHRIGPGEACYTVLLNKEGGIIDDLIIYDLGINNKNKECLLIVINAGCIDKDIAWIKQHISSQQISISDFKKDGVLLALQGPESNHQLQKIIGDSFVHIPRYGHRQIEIKLK